MGKTRAELELAGSCAGKLSLPSTTQTLEETELALVMCRGSGIPKVTTDPR